jgi:hypothetical protein
MGQVRQHLAKDNYQSPSSAIAAVRAELIGANCAIAPGIKAHSPSPVLALCRDLVEAGHDPATPLHAYRGDTLCLRIKSIGQAAQLEPSPTGIGFVRSHSRLRAAPPIAPTAPAKHPAPPLRSRPSAPCPPTNGFTALSAAMSDVIDRIENHDNDHG